MQVYDETGNRVYDKEIVIEKWKNDFNTLLNLNTTDMENANIEVGIA